MSIHYANYKKYDFPNLEEVERLIRLFEDTRESKNRHEYFTEKELHIFLKLCDIAEKQVVEANQTFGFAVKSEDRCMVEAMLEAKKGKKIQVFPHLLVVEKPETPKPQKVYVVVDRQQPNAPIGVFEDIKQAKEAAKLFRFQKDACKYRKGMDNWPWIWEIVFDTPCFDRLPREICY